ncbi:MULTISPECIES: methyl-accepting chemotaxis protein [Paraburkholderia]|uniref:HAMP domain-containing protein n=1 Tax=Paraburkholderia podalyriae TaxID=1938811 RepID=A0ABR7Q0K9_9BURK|nr:methyl-accepting chemotaxis protein [Paraburkholderia podalyriae]MBC8752085.1 HAMP domain-containing protein [Paraburkholderia podalyriae]
MFKNLTIRTGLSVTIAVYTIALLASILTAAVGVHRRDVELEQMYSNDTVALVDLKASAERLLQARLALNDVETSRRVGGNAEQVLSNARKMLDESEVLLSTGLSGHPVDGNERALADTLRLKRDALLTRVIAPQIAALEQNDILTSHAIQAQAGNAAYADYRNASGALESYHTERQRQRYEVSAKRFELGLWVSATTGIGVVLLGLFARIALAAAIGRPVDTTIRHFARIAAGDLTGRIETGRRNEMGQLATALGRMQGGLVNTVGQVRSSTDAIGHGIREIAAGNSDLSARTEQQAASLEETAASMEQLTVTVRQNAENAREASALAVRASGIAQRGGQVVGEVVGMMDGISASSREIVDIIAVIEGIAFQTNILALNAAVEAARAGEEGRGFAVVAGEVRSLAQRSATAAREIKELIGDTAAKVQSGSELVIRAGSTMDDVALAVKHVTDIMSEISAASDQQSSGIEQVNCAIVQMDQVTQQNAALVEQAAAAAAASLAEQACRLQSAVAAFRVCAQAEQ